MIVAQQQCSYMRRHHAAIRVRSQGRHAKGRQQGRRLPPPQAAGIKQQAPAFSIEERMQFLTEDLTHLFDDQGIDASAYDDPVTFEDPLTKIGSAAGYRANINFLRFVFDPKFELHDLRQTGEHEVTSRWTMTMALTPARFLRKWWQPNIIFTGTSIYGFNPANGRINRHIDTWDSISNQRFFSPEAFADFWRQLLQFHTTPAGLDTPQYTVLRRTKGYQVRQYKPFLVAETQLDPAAASPASGAAADAEASSSSDQEQEQQQRPGPRSYNPAGAGTQAFRSLAGYIFGANSQQTKMAMTTPVFSSTSGTMQFVLPRSATLDSLPAPKDAAMVAVKQREGGMYAARIFGGVATPAATQREHQLLLDALRRDGLRAVQEGQYSLARYNDPGVRPAFRRNEVLVELAAFDLWN